MTRLAESPRRLFSALALAEAVTWTLLIAGMLQKYVFDAGDWGVRIGGGLHGFVFLAFGAVTLLVAVNQRWSPTVTVLTLVASVIPWATVPTERALERRGRLDGPWRHDAHRTGDRRAPDRVLALVLSRPVLSAVVTGAGVTVVFGVLLAIGPPGGPRGG